MTVKCRLSVMMAITIAISGVFGHSPARAGDLEDIPGWVGSLAAGLLNGYFSRKQSKAAYESSTRRDYATAARDQEASLTYFLDRDAVARREILLTQDERFFQDHYGISKEVVVAMHNGLCGRKSNDAEFVVDKGEGRPSTTNEKTQTVAEIRQNLPSENIVLLGLLRGQPPKAKESWRPVLSNDEPEAFDTVVVTLDRLPMKIVVFGDVDSARVEVAWYRDMAYQKNLDGSYQKNPDGSWVLVPRKKDDLEADVVRQVGGFYSIKSLNWAIPAGAERLSLKISVWNADAKAEVPDEDVNFLLVKQRANPTPTRAENGRLSAVPESFRRFGTVESFQPQREVGNIELAWRQQ